MIETNFYLKNICDNIKKTCKVINSLTLIEYKRVWLGTLISISLFSRSRLAKSIPVHCVVESVSHVYPWSHKYSPSLHRSKGYVELDRFVIIPNDTAFRDLTEVALVRLGYSKDTAASSKGFVVLKNWLPLDLDTIAEDPVLTVNDVLGELTTLATLKIVVFRYDDMASAITQ